MKRKEFPSVIERTRKELDMSQREFADLLGVHHRTINGAERGENQRLSGPFATLIYLCQFPEVIWLLKRRLLQK